MNIRSLSLAFVFATFLGSTAAIASSTTEAALAADPVAEKRDYQSSTMPMTEAAIDASLTRDVYVSLGEPLTPDRENGAWAVRVYFKPFVDWIWGGCLLMALGGLLAMLDRRYRVKARTSSPVKTPAGTQQA